MKTRTVIVQISEPDYDQMVSHFVQGREGIPIVTVFEFVAVDEVAAIKIETQGGQSHLLLLPKEAVAMAERALTFNGGVSRHHYIGTFDRCDAFSFTDADDRDFIRPRGMWNYEFDRETESL